MRLAYSRTVGYDTPRESEAIWTVRPDGSENQLLLNDDSMPRWTAGGNIVTFGGILVQWATREEQRFKIDGIDEDAGSVSMSPDGKYLLFETNHVDRQAAVARVLFEGDPAVNPFLLLHTREAYEPRWSPTSVPLTTN